MAFQQDIVVTGIGVVSPIGIGKDPFWAALIEGRSGIRRQDLARRPDLPPPIGGAVSDFDPKQYVRPRKSLKVMSRDIQLAFAAADLACVEAGLRDRPVDPERLGVVFGASMIPCEVEELVGTYRGCLLNGAFEFERWGRVAMGELFPLWMLKYLPNMPACHVGIAQDARGPNNTITLGDASSLSALAEGRGFWTGVRPMRSSPAGSACGCSGAMGAEARCRGCRGVPRRRRRHRDPSTPAATARSAARGPAALLIETGRHASARGATMLARLLGSASAFEPCRS